MWLIYWAVHSVKKQYTGKLEWPFYFRLQQTNTSTSAVTVLIQMQGLWA